MTARITSATIKLESPPSWHELPVCERRLQTNREEQRCDRRLSRCNRNSHPALLDEIKFVDASIAAFVDELKEKGLYDSTLIVITAKHGQSPIDPNRFIAQAKVGTTPATLLSNADLLPYSESTNNPTGIGPTEDDVSLLWLKHTSQTDDAVKLLEQNGGSTGIALGQILYGSALAINYNSPKVDPRTPDIIVTPNPGVVYTGSSKKQEEHGGFAHDDTT